MERVRALAPVGTDHDAHRERRARFMRAQRAQIVGDALRQHRHDAIGEVDRVAADECLAIKPGARSHIMGDVRDRDAQHMAAGIGGIGVGFGVHRVVVILGVGRVDGDERHVAPVLAPGKLGRPRGVGLLDHVMGKHVANAVRRDRDQADGAFVLDRAVSLFDAPARGPKGLAVDDDLDGDELAVLRLAAVSRWDHKLAPHLLLVGRCEPAAAIVHRAKDAIDPRGCGLGDPDHAAGVADRVVGIVGRLDPHHRAVADAGDLARPGAPQALEADLGRRAVRLLVPFGRCCDQLAVAVALADLGEHELRQGSRGGAFLLAAPTDVTFLAELLQQRPDGVAVGAMLEAEGVHDLAAVDLARLAGDEGQNLVPGGQGCDTLGGSRSVHGGRCSLRHRTSTN
jgi:hypothetical protein